MISNRISVDVSQEDREAILKAFEILTSKLPFLISLTPDEIQSIPKIGTRSHDFVDKALEVALQNPEIMPRGFDIDEMRKDVETYKLLTAVHLSLMQLMEKVADTQTLVGSEAYAGALAVYYQSKGAGKGLGLEGATDELAKRFSRKLKAKPSDSEAPPSK